MNLKVLYQWFEQLARHLPSMNYWQLCNLTLFCVGVLLSESSQQMSIARKVVDKQRVSSMERRLRRFLSNQKWDMNRFMVEWTRWILSCLEDEYIHLFVDESKLGNRIGIMMVGVGFENRCIPLAWRCYKGNSAKDYPPEGQVEVITGLLELVRAGLPDKRKVVLSADRGIGTSPRLCLKVDGLEFKYLFRITKQSKILTEDGELTIYERVKPGTIWQAQGKVFKQRGRLPAFVRAIWDKDCDEPWLLITNDPELTGREYARRNWQEQSFRDLKSGGWNWSKSYVRCPQRMTRLIAILTVAYAWTLSMGCHAVEQGLARPLTRGAKSKPRRQWSLFKEGLMYFVERVTPNYFCPTLRFILDKRLC